MNKPEIKALQSIIMGNSYQESIINKALTVADSLEVKVCLNGLKRGRGNNHAFMRLQDFVCRLSAAAEVVDGEIMLMNPSTGSVGSISDWADEGFGLDDGLIAVVQDSDGDWIEDKH